MQIVRHDDAILVIHQGPWGLRAMGLAFAALGVGVLWIITHGHLAEHNAWVAVVVGVTFSIAGLAMLLLASDVVCTFDKGTRTTTIRKRGLRAASSSIYAWNDVEDAALEESASVANGTNRGTPTFRPVLVMKNGARVPWLSYFTSSYDAQANCVAAARSFAGWHELPDASRDTDAAAARKAADATRFGRVLGLVIVAVFAGVGVLLCGQQVQRYLAWQPVRARITMSDLATSRDGKGHTTYRPVIQYAYALGGTEQLASGATILTISSSYDWADGIRRRYRVGDSVTAYVDPRHAGTGYVVRQLSWLPLVFVLLPLIAAYLIVHSAARGQPGLRLAGAQHVPVLAA